VFAEWPRGSPPLPVTCENPDIATKFLFYPTPRRLQHSQHVPHLRTIGSRLLGCRTRKILNAMQPIYGKMSDIYGRKSLLLVVYVVFATGSVIVGVAQSMSNVILGRVISGLGASGMTAFVSILITDLVPLRDVATWRSHVNIAATTGRSIGGPLGGFLAGTVGWRWSVMG
jgi:MFS family permease